MADEKHAGMLVERLKSAQDASERRHAALALLATCGRERIKCEPVVIGAFAEADAATRALLMRMLPLTARLSRVYKMMTRASAPRPCVSSLTGAIRTPFLI